MQDRSPAGRDPHHLHESEAQAAAGVKAWHESQASIFH
jgi:hypothetical protein